MPKRIYAYVGPLLCLAAGTILWAVTATNAKPTEFKIALAYSCDTWGAIEPCG